MSMKQMNDDVLGAVSGGAAGWSNGTHIVNHGAYIEYTVTCGDALSSIAPRFGVTAEEIEQWNGLRGPEGIKAGQKLTIYPRVPV